VSRGIDYVEGWSAVAWVAGTGGGTLLAAFGFWLLARTRRDRRATVASYRAEASAASRGADNARGLAVVLLVIALVSQLLYVGLYVELVRWRLGAPEPPRIVFGLFFWVLLVCATSVGGALAAAWQDGPRVRSGRSRSRASRRVRRAFGRGLSRCPVVPLQASLRLRRAALSPSSLDGTDVRGPAPKAFAGFARRQRVGW
jgi:hypothetical protein